MCSVVCIGGNSSLLCALRGMSFIIQHLSCSQSFIPIAVGTSIIQSFSYSINLFQSFSYSILLSFNPYRKSIVSRQNIVGQHFNQFVVDGYFVAQVSQIGATRFQLPDNVERFAKTQVCGVLLNAQSVDNQGVKALQFIKCGILCLSTR